MLPFFRKIRYRLAEDNQLFKYGRYALGEIVLVVIGILIAIQLNAWKTDQEDRSKVLKYMEGLRADLEKDNERMDSLYVFYSGIANSIQLLLTMEDQKQYLTNEELGKMFNASLEYKKFANKKSTYLSIINEGFINKVNDKNLVNQMIRYYESPFLTWSTEIYGDLLGSVDYNQSDIYDSRDILLSLNDNNSIPGWQLTNVKYRTNYGELIRTPWAINIFTTCLKQSDFVFNNLDSYKKMNVELRKEIKKYLNKE